MKGSKDNKKRLIIVESPSKARTIKKLLGSDFEVKASMGHIKDLPTNRMGIDFEHGFEPEYEIINGKEKIIKELKKAAKSVKAIYLASDPDREGEAIAWHIFQEINRPDATYRIEFHEITEEAVKNAINNPKSIDMNKVQAQIARRVLDRIVGYKLSPLLWRKIEKGLSAGRVQSVALRLICEREQEIENFTPEEYWKVEATFKVGDVEFKAYLDTGKDKKLTKEEAEEILKQISKEEFVLTSIEKKQRRQKPKPPFITSTMQQEAFKVLGFSSKKTMLIAQQLYEGMDIGESAPVGLITYMRTDSVRISEEALKNVVNFIRDHFSEEYVPSKPNVFETKGKIQDAHEAIRPTSVLRTPESLLGKIPQDHWRLYDLIWRRFVASQMKPALIESTVFKFRVKDYIFKASGKEILFDGYRILYKDKEEDRLLKLPDLKEGSVLVPHKVEATQHFTSPPPRYTEASLIKVLEEKGIGRPSTYATIVSTLLDRGYVLRDKKSLVPTPLGRIVSSLLVKSFPKLMDVSFTARMEEDLDRIAEGIKDWRKSIEEFYAPFSRELEKASDIFNLEDISPVKCDMCGKPMVIKKSKYGKFLACSGYPECKNIKPLIEERRKTVGTKNKNKRRIKNS